MPSALPTSIAVTCNAEWPAEWSRCGALARQLPVLAPGLCRLALTCGFRCAIHNAIRECRPLLNRLNAFDLTVTSRDSGCAQSPPIYDALGNEIEELRPPAAYDREFRLASLPETVVDLRIALVDNTRRLRIGTVAAHLPRLARLTLPEADCRLFRHDKSGIVGDDNADADPYSSDDSGDDEDDDGSLAVRKVRLEALPIPSLTHLSVRHIDRAIRPHAFPVLQTLAVANDSWAGVLTSILLHLPQLIELRLGVPESETDVYASVNYSDMQQDLAEEDNVALDPEWAPELAVTRANAEFDAAESSRRELPRTIRRVTLGRLSSNRAMRRLALRLAPDVEQLRIVSGDGVGDLTPFAAHHIARLELPEHEYRMLRLFPTSAYLSRRARDTRADGFHSYAIERVERLVLTHMPPAELPRSTMWLKERSPYDDNDAESGNGDVGDGDGGECDEDDGGDGGKGDGGGASLALDETLDVVARSSSSPPQPQPQSEPQPQPLLLGYAQPHCLEFGFEFDLCGDCTRKATARFQALAERYPDVRHLVLPPANIGPDGVFASVVGDVLLRFKRLVTVDASRLHVRSGEKKVTAAAGSEDGRADPVADILRRRLHPAEFALLRFSPLDLGDACGCAPGD
jgi:hypothetical protein